MKFFTKLFKDEGEKAIKRLEPIVAHINTLEQDYVNLSDAELAGKTEEFKKRIQEGGETVDDLLPEAFAVVREGARRTLVQRHYDVQLMGGIIMHQGAIPEMRTGEGKTLTATLAVYLNALSGKGVHVVTVNDYLSRRDAAWMGQVYHALGLSVSCVNHQTAYVYDPDWKVPEQTTELTMEDLAEASEKEEGGAVDQKRDATGSFQVEMDYLRPVGRKDAYLADITYGTNNEYGFDYLRDNMAVRPEQKVQRPLHYAIVDEVDSILIDEARTPLIISAPAEEAADTYYKFATLVKPLQEDVDFNSDEKIKTASFTEEGQNRVSRELGFDPWADNDTRTIF